MAQKPLAPALVFDNPFFTVGALDPDLIILTRLARPFTAKEDIERGCWPVQLALDRYRRRGRRLLIDTRQAVGNNDAAFEASFAEHRLKMVVGFDRVALLVQTAVGRLQNERLATGVATRPRASSEPRASIPPPAEAPRVFMSFDVAVAYLRRGD